MGLDLTFSQAMPSVAESFDPGSEWHLYRLEVEGNTIRLAVDGRMLIETSDNNTLANGSIGLFSVGAQVSVRSFKVIAL